MLGPLTIGVKDNDVEQTTRSSVTTTTPHMKIPVQDEEENEEEETDNKMSPLWKWLRSAWRALVRHVQGQFSTLL